MKMVSPLGGSSNRIISDLMANEWKRRASRPSKEGKWILSLILGAAGNPAKVSSRPYAEGEVTKRPKYNSER